MTTSTPERQTAIFRLATHADLDAIMAVEQSWDEEGRASADTLAVRMTRFPQGFFVGCLEQDGREKIVATVTSMPMRHDPADISGFASWDNVTNGGRLHEDMALEECNALYIVSGVIDRAYRGHNIFAPGILAQAQQAGLLGLRYVLAGAVIPGYRNYCERHGEVEAWRYCATRRGKHLVDPLLAMYESIGFAVGEPRHVLPEYFPDHASRNYAALVMRDLQSAPLTSITSPAC